MLVKILKSKIHRATITEAEIDYVGSITIDRDLMDAAGMVVGECVLVADMTDGARFETYVIEADRGSGTICVNGAAARLVSVEDEVIIMSFGYVDADKTDTVKPDVVLVDKQNRVVRKL